MMNVKFRRGMTMECGTCREWMSLWLDGRLVQAEIEQVEGHIATCPDCRTALDALRHVDRLLSAAPLVQPRANWAPAPNKAPPRTANSQRDVFRTRGPASVTIFKRSDTSPEMKAPISTPMISKTNHDFSGLSFPSPK